MSTEKNMYDFTYYALKIATMLIINIIVTILVMIYLVRFILKQIVKTNVFNNKLGLFIGVNKKKITKKKEIDIPFKKLNFIKHKNKFVLLAVVLLLTGILSLFTRGANLGIDYTGGTSITVSNEKIIYTVVTKYFSGNMLFTFANGKMAKVELRNYETKTNRKKLIGAYSDEFIEKIDKISSC